MFNYKETVNEVLTKDWTNIDDTVVCNCASSRFCDPYHGHVVCGNLLIIENKKVRDLLAKGPTYREPMNVDWKKFVRNFKISLESCVAKWASDEKVNASEFDGWMKHVLCQVRSKVRKLSSRPQCRRKSILNSPSHANYLKKMQESFVFVPTDKASNNIAVVCKNFYIQKSLEELGIGQDSSNDDDDEETKTEEDSETNRNRRRS